MVGLPFANMQSIELKEKLAFMQRSSAVDKSEYYENMCMRAVNQSIGRAIRHERDYAAILLLDHRYSRVVAKLPGWIRDAGVGTEGVEDAVKNVGSFFRSGKAIIK